MAVGLLAAILALVSQIALGAVVVPDDALAAQARLVSASVICVGHASGAAGGKTRHHPHAPGKALCPLGVALASQSCVLTPSVLLASPAPVITARIAAAPPARGPPPPTARVGEPRAPPVPA